MKTVHHVKVTFSAGPLLLKTEVLVNTAGARDSVITWARENGYKVSWQTDTVPEIFTADEAIAAIREEIAECKAQIGE